MTTIEMDHDMRSQLMDHVIQTWPNECCGLLAGRVEGTMGIVTMVFQLVNELHSPIAFRSEPKSLLEADRIITRCNLSVLAIYHSHPTSLPIPSQFDRRDHHYDKTASVIIGRLENEPWQIRAWWPDQDWREITIHDTARIPDDANAQFNRVHDTGHDESHRGRDSIPRQVR